MIASSDLPRFAAVVANPARSECPANFSGSNPARLRAALDDPRHARGVQSLPLEVPVAVDPAEDRALGDARGLQPAGERAHGADGRQRGERDPFGRAAPLLVALRAAQRHDEALVAAHGVAGVERHELGAPEGAEPPQRQQRAIAIAGEPVAGRLEQRDELLVDDGAFCAGAVPRRRRIPARTSVRAGCERGQSTPCDRCTWAIAVTARSMVETRRPTSASAAAYKATSSGLAGIAATPWDEHHASKLRKSERYAFFVEPARPSAA